MKNLFLSLWNYFRGYVIVEVSGYSIDKFIRLAVSNHVVLWKVVRRKDKLYLHTTIQGFKRLKPYAQKARCRLRITEKKGMPFLTFKYRKRWIFAIGSILFAIGIYILASFVWLVDVAGNERLDTSELITTLETAGYTTGKLKGSLDLRQAEKVLMNTYPEIVWAGIEFEGTKMVVQVSESIPKPEVYEKGAPCDLIAKRDTLITSIVTDKGMPKVKVGDTVKKGEVLISGSIPLEDEHGTIYVTESIGKVKGKTGYSLKATLPLQRIQKDYTNEVATSYSVKFFNTKLSLYNNKKTFENYDTLVTINQLRLTDAFPLPFYFEKNQKVAYNPVQVRVDEEEAKDKLLGALHDKLREEMGENAIVVKQEIIYTRNEDYLAAELNVIAEEDIAVKHPLTDEGVNQ